MSFNSQQYASFTPDPELNKREWFNERGGYIIRSRYYPGIENINIQNNQMNKECENNIKTSRKNKEYSSERMDGGYIQEDRIRYNQPSNFLDFLNYYFKNLLR